jgi:hypothetical protein
VILKKGARWRASPSPFIRILLPNSDMQRSGVLEIDGQMVKRDYQVNEGDVIELHI